MAVYAGLMERPELIRRLYNLGFSPYEEEDEAVRKTKDDTLDNMIALYQEHHKLEPGETVLLRSLQAIRFCSLPDRAPQRASVCRWPTKDVKFTITQSLPSLSQAQFKAAAIQACEEWNKVCGIKLQWVDNSAQAQIVMMVRKIDRAGGILAESELPCSSNPRLCRQWYDTYENWVLTTTGSGFAIYLPAVICHEVGHAIGLDHTSDGGLMDPTYKPGLSKPTGRSEIAGVVARYGAPTATPPPVEPPVEGEQFLIRVTGNISIDGYRLTKLGG